LRAQRSRIGILAVAVVVVALLALVLGALLVS
jgi:hypothetical protein